jgi:hypothetical protein
LTVRAGRRKLHRRLWNTSPEEPHDARSAEARHAICQRPRQRRGVAEKTALQFKNLPYKAKKTEWMALRRMLDKTDASYKN